MKDLREILNTLNVGDALDVLSQFPDEFVDISVTSPPYNKQINTYGWLVQTNRYSHYNDRIPEDRYQEWQIEVLDELFRVIKPGGSLFYNHKLRWSRGVMYHPIEWIARSKWTIRQEIVWDRTLAANVRGWRFWQIDERIYWLYKPIDEHLVGAELESRHAKMSSIWRIKPLPRNDDHPAAFPVALPLRAIYSMTGTAKKVILDPFCGIGTTLVAAKLLKHDYIGIDISPDYVQVAQSRLQDFEKERYIANEEIKLHVIRDPFKDRKKRGTVSWPFAPNNTDGVNEDVDNSQK